MSLRRGANVAMLGAAVVIIGAGIRYSAPLLVPFLMAGFIATVTAPLVFWLQRRNVPRPIAVFAALSVSVASIFGLALLVGGSVTAFYQQLPQYEVRVTGLVEQASTALTSLGIEISNDSILDVADPSWLMGMVGTFFRSVASLVSRLFLVMLVVAFMLVEATALRKKMLMILPDNTDMEMVRGAAREVNKYLVVKTATSATTGVLAGAWCALLGVDLPLLWGLLAFLLNYIPTVGSIIAAIPPALLAMIQFGPLSGIGVLAGYLAINVTIGNMIEPRFMGRALGLSAMVVFMSMIVWGWLLGPVGALLSAPLTMMVKQWLSRTEDLQWIAVILGPTPRDPA